MSYTVKELVDSIVDDQIEFMRRTSFWENVILSIAMVFGLCGLVVSVNINIPFVVCMICLIILSVYKIYNSKRQDDVIKSRISEIV